MRPVRTVRSNVLYRGDGQLDGAVADLYAERVTPGIIRQVWQPTDADRAVLAAGGSLIVYVMTEPIPPIAVEVSDHPDDHELVRDQVAARLLAEV